MIRPPVGLACSEQLKLVAELNVDCGRTQAFRRTEVDLIVGRLVGLRFYLEVLY